MTDYFKKALVVILFLTGGAAAGRAQALEPVERPLYVSAALGTSFGQCTFRSITEYQITPGIQGGLFAGYRFNRLFSLEAGLQAGRQTQSAMDCCTYWLSQDGMRYMIPVLDETGWYYHDITSHTGWSKLSLQAHANLLSLLTAPGSKWSLNVGPQMAAVTTKTKLVTPDKTIENDRQWHLGLGGQAGIGYQITERFGASLYSSIICLTGQRFDNIPEHAHKSNLIWNAGLRLNFYL